VLVTHPLSLLAARWAHRAAYTKDIFFLPIIFNRSPGASVP